MEQTITIGENHKRILRTVLVMLDEALCEFDAWANGREYAGIIFAECNDLSSEQRQLLRENVAILREDLQSLTEGLGLERTLQAVRHAIIAKANVIWEGLSESDPPYLRRYGEMDSHTVEYLRPKFQALIRGVENILAICMQR